jgi:hypothetical protein
VLILVFKILVVLFLGLYMQKIRKKWANCKTLANLSNAFNKGIRKIKTTLSPSTITVAGSKQKGEAN